MKIKLIGSTNNYKTKKEFLKFSRACGRQCYSGKDFDDLENEPYNYRLVDSMLKSGHHSVFEHINLTFSMKGLPKALAMILNNEKQYATSEKSARYTQMKDIESLQKEKYGKWMKILKSEIDKAYPTMQDNEKRETAIKKLAQENARYMTSVFTPTKMIHTVNLRQLNHLIYSMKEFIDENKNNGNYFDSGLVKYMREFIEQVNEFKIDELKNQTDRYLSFFGKPVEESFKDVYSINYVMSFAGLAQAHRHRTLNYQISEEIELGAPYGFYVPKIIRKYGKESKIKTEWLKDLKEIAETDFPQAQLIPITERGTLEDFRSKMILRLCGHAQYEIMEKTLEIAKTYYKEDNNFPKEWLNPKCVQGMVCNNPCVWGGKKALERLV